MRITKITEEKHPLTTDRRPLSLDQLQRECDYYRAEKLLRLMFEKELISEEEFMKIMRLNRESFMPLLAQVMSEIT